MAHSLCKLWNFRKPPYIVLLGDVSTGKSTIVEKLTGEKGRSSDANESFTKTSSVLWVPDGSLIVSDTPGSNALKDKLQHNIEIAVALNFRPVSRIFIVVKGETRIDNVVDNVRKYADRFLELPMDVVGVLVTHMDMVDWTEEEFAPRLEDELGIDTVVFSRISTKREALLQSILKTCKKEYNLTVNNENFFKLFKIHNNHRKILQSTSDEVKNFSEKKKAFDEARKAFSGKDLVDLVFEFQAYMTDEIVQAQKRISEKNKFTFYGDGAANEAGHVANMVNQLRMVLYDIRTECREYQSEHGVSELRKCPYCGTIWTKVEGSESDTTCGNRPSTVNDFRNSAYSVLGTFSFRWLANSNLEITKSGGKTVKSVRKSSSPIGCGKTINWKEMATVSVPPEFSETVKVGTSDINVLPPMASRFNKQLSYKMRAAQRKLSLPERPSPVADPDLEGPSPVADSDLERPSPVADPDLERPSPVADPDLIKPYPGADPDLERPPPVADLDLIKPSPVADPDLERPPLVADPHLIKPYPGVDPDLESPPPVADLDLKTTSPFADPDLKLRRGPCSVLLALLVVLLSVIIFFFYPK